LFYKYLYFYLNIHSSHFLRDTLPEKTHPTTNAKCPEAKAVCDLAQKRHQP